MILETKKIISKHIRTSKLGIKHEYTRTKTIAIIQCDNCTITFERELGKMDHRRLDNGYSHVCPNCNPKQFAQRKGVNQRVFWNTPADSDIDITKL